jgi:hypothetical protein
MLISEQRVFMINLLVLFHPSSLIDGEDRVSICFLRLLPVSHLWFSEWNSSLEDTGVAYVVLWAILTASLSCRYDFPPIITYLVYFFILIYFLLFVVATEKEAEYENTTAMIPE